MYLFVFHRGPAETSGIVLCYQRQPIVKGKLDELRYNHVLEGLRAALSQDVTGT